MRIFLSLSMNAHRLANFSQISRARSMVLAIGSLALAVAGCGSSRPIKYYQLSYPAPNATQLAPLNVSLLVRSFEASHIYQEERIVYSTSPNELGLYEEQRWVAPPVAILQDALVRGLRAAGLFRSVMLVHGEGGGNYSLAGHLYEFGEVDGADIVARLSYTVRLRDRKTGLIVWTHFYAHDEPASAKTMPAVVAAMDKNVQRSVQEVQASLEEYFRANPPR